MLIVGHEQVQTTMVYLDVTTEQEAKALAILLAMLEEETIRKPQRNGSMEKAPPRISVG